MSAYKHTNCYQQVKRHFIDKKESRSWNSLGPWGPSQAPEFKESCDSQDEINSIVKVKKNRVAFLHAN